jgi:hypothetical protein
VEQLVERHCSTRIGDRLLALVDPARQLAPANRAAQVVGTRVAG